MLSRSPLIFAGSMLAACSFDPSGIAPSDAGAEVDGAPVDDGGAPADATPCADDVHLELSIGGVTGSASPEAPYLHALPGDVIELSARGSCGRSGALAYAWQISPIDETRTTASPDLVSETITVYPVLPKDYTVTLTVRSGDASATRSVLGVRVHPWQRHDALPEGLDIRDLAVGGDTLWLAHSGGAHRLPLDGPADPDEFVDLRAEAEGVALGSEFGAVAYHAGDSSIWLGQQTRRDDLVRLDRGVSPPLASSVSLRAVFDASVQVHDIIEHAGDIAVATDRGAVIVDGHGVPVGDRFTPPDTAEVHALASISGQLWVGSRRLYQANADGMVIDPYEGMAGADDRIRALAVDPVNRKLWVASDGHGIARLDTSEGTPGVIAVYSGSTGALRSDRVRDIAVEHGTRYQGDVWVATSAGVGRYIRARDTWLFMDDEHGLEQRSNTGAVAIDDEAGRRAIYVGTRSGLVSLRLH